jgi:ATP-dependent helicase HrpB
MKLNSKLALPIDKYIDSILEATLDHSTVLVKASPGSGKTTRLPWAISHHLSKKVAVLEPRRLAAKLAARRISEEQNLTLGSEVGYHFRFEKMCNENTRVTFYTEGTFLRKFLKNSFLNDLDLIILDEFHERHLETDLTLALLRELQKTRPLKIILMSATLDLELMGKFPDAKVIHIEAPYYPVEIVYLPNRPSILNMSLEAKVKNAVEESSGDTLVFLPGMREMLKVRENLHGHYEVFLLHADLSKEEQAHALEASDRRKIILSTNIAESSVTIPGIEVVIDSGIQRGSWYSPWNGLKFVQDTAVTQSSAIQRAGRAGRTGPGICYRLYSQHDFNERQEHTIPEIDRADLTNVCLLVAGTNLAPDWFQAPNVEKWKKSVELLEKMGAIKNDQITELGKEMLDYPLDSRLSRTLIAGKELSYKSKESLLNYVCEKIEGDKTGMLKRRLSYYLQKSGKDDSPWEKCLLYGFIDQVARFRTKQRDFIHYSGKILKAHYSLNDLEEGLYIVVNITQRQEANEVIQISEDWPWEMEPFPLKEESDVEISEKISVKLRTKLGSIVLDEASLQNNWDGFSHVIKEKIIAASESLKKQKIESWKETSFFGRIHFWSRNTGVDLNECLEKIVLEDYFTSYNTLSWNYFSEYLQTFIESQMDLKNFDIYLPTKINLEGRRELVIHYPIGMDPYLEAPIQDFYGLNQSPSILGGMKPLLLKMLGPHKRPIQVTKDLTSFWKNTYPEIKKEYQRDYPRHYWPDRPWEAKPYLLKSHLPKI